MVNLKEYNNIKEYLVANPDGTYEAWIAQWNPRAGKREKKQLPTTEYEKEWKELWSLWPSTPNFEYMGRKYTGDRVLKSEQVVCNAIWLRAIKSGLSPEVIYNAAKAEIEAKKQESHKTGQNKLQYLNGLSVWLRQAKWEAWMDVKMDFGDSQVQQIREIVHNSTDM